MRAAVIAAGQIAIAGGLGEIREPLLAGSERLLTQEALSARIGR